MSTSRRLARGAHVRVRHVDDTGDWCPAFVALASDNSPSSVMLILGGMVRAGEGFMGGGLPLTVDYDTETATSLLGDEYEIEIEEADALPQ